MSFETRTRWIPISELTTDHDIAGFGPVDVILHRDGRVRVVNPNGVSRDYSERTSVELYEGVFDTRTGKKVSMSIEEYRASLRDERSRS